MHPAPNCIFHRIYKYNIKNILNLTFYKWAENFDKLFSTSLNRNKNSADEAKANIHKVWQIEKHSI